MTTKREPTLADYFAYGHNPLMWELIGEKRVKTLQARARSAHRFVFDEEASVRVAKVARDLPELILRESQFARAPYDLTWIEYQAAVYWNVLNDQVQVADHHDIRVGFLIDHNQVIVIAQGEDNPNSCGVYPIAYHLNTEWPVADQIRFADIMQTSRLGLDIWMWGASADYFLKRGEHERMRELRSNNMAEFICDLKRIKPESAQKILTGAQGDMRTIITFLLMLNRPSATQYKNYLPNHRGWLKSRFVPYLSHTTIHVSLDAGNTIKLVGTPQGETVERRRTEVRGHYCHDQTARDYMRIAGCIHDWEPTGGPETGWARSPNLLPNDVNHWVCGTCGGKRWWRAEHERGSAAVGFVHREGYEVTE